MGFLRVEKAHVCIDRGKVNLCFSRCAGLKFWLLLHWSRKLHNVMYMYPGAVRSVEK